LKIDKMKIDDYEAVYDLWMNTPGMGLNSIDDSKAGIEKYLKRNPETCFTAKENGRVLGVILSGHDGRRGYIHHTAVLEEARFKGIGRKLVEKSIEALREEGIKKVAFVVFRRNTEGNAFWRKLGFEERDDLIYRNKKITKDEIVRIDT
jgi:N-acetylglutamate synthase